ncbi:type II secretion system protein N [Sphingomonas naphthae]|uniref:Type II secretion system protein N n=1 Tax=Sphingomonas naphthae TaxID=1813468 RepID=A0ABY7TJD0_9SPHN|nr:type II secretion system protein N [Sphingomonas naphthae]WCT72881.1 type II secretion system protein N [Sphingomonas naphthae]
MTPRQTRIAADIFTGAVIASVAIAFAGLTWRLAAGLGTPAPAAPIPTLPRPQVDVSPIVALAPFGSGATGAPTPTGLPLELKGVMLAIPSDASTALIASAGGAAPIAYRIGQAVPGGGPIETIGIDNVIFSVSGHREQLAFPKPGATAPSATQAAPPIINPGAPPAMAVQSPPPGAAPPPPPMGAGPMSPQAMLSSIGAEPINGGYRVGQSLSPTVRAAGLQPGDVVESVNGTKLGNPAQDQQTLAAAMRSGTVRIDVMRGSQHMTLALPAR